METFIELVLRHLGTSAIMDLTCNLISGIEAPEYRQNALNVSRRARVCCRGRAVVGFGVRKLPVAAGDGLSVETGRL